MSDDRLKIAVFIDFDNIEIGVKSTLNSYFDIGAVLEAIKERGEIVTKVAYGDWTRAGDYGRALSQHAVHMVQRNLTPGGDKNGADINLALDALEMAFTHSHINSFVIISGDSDFISLVEKLKQYDRKVFVVGGRAFTSVVMQKNCTEFIAYENIVGRGRSAERGGSRSGSESPLAQAMPLMRRALKLLADREVLPQLGLLKSTLLQLDSAFSEREYGAGSFRDFVQKLAKAGYVTLKGSERSFHVELREGAEPAPAPAAVPSQPASPPAVVNGSASGDEGSVSTSAEEANPASATGAPRPTPADAVRTIQLAIARAGTPRWPLYVRQIKQLIRAVDAQFDERRYGFGSLIDALKHGQREGVVRLERDRQGIVRVWPGDHGPKGAGTTEISTAGGDRPAGEPAHADEADGEAAVPMTEHFAHLDPPARADDGPHDDDADAGAFPPGRVPISWETPDERDGERTLEADARANAPDVATSDATYDAPYDATNDVPDGDNLVPDGNRRHTAEGPRDGAEVAASAPARRRRAASGNRAEPRPRKTPVPRRTPAAPRTRSRKPVRDKDEEEKSTTPTAGRAD